MNRLPQAIDMIEAGTSAPMAMAAKATPANQAGNMVQEQRRHREIVAEAVKARGICRHRLHPRRHRHEAQQRHQRQREGIDRQQDGIALDRAGGWTTTACR